MQVTYKKSIHVKEKHIPDDFMPTIQFSDDFVRFKKIERIRELEDQVERLKMETSQLSKEVDTLTEEITSLRSKLDEHKETGFCQINFFDQITGSKRHFG